MPNLIFRPSALALAASLSVAASAQAAPGELDLSWGLGGSGKTIMPFDIGAGLTDRAAASVVASDGSMYVVGRVIGADSIFRIGVAKLDADGLLDHTFDGDGKSVNPFLHVVPMDAALSLDESRLYVAGYSANPSTPNRADFVLCQFDANTGTRPSFPAPLTSSCTTTNLGVTLSKAYAMAVQPDGKIVLAGTFGATGSTYAMFARFLPNGQLDGGTFASPSGITAIRGDLYTAHEIRDVTITSNGKIAAVGRTRIDGEQDDWGLVMRLDADGAQDLSEYAFSRDDSTTRDTRLEAVAAVPDEQSDDDRLVVAGSVELTTDKTSGLLARVHPSGAALDTGFGEFGDATTVTLGNSSLHYDDIALLDDGGIVALGTRTSSDTVLDVSRFSELGVPDVDFGTSNAHTVIDFDTPSGSNTAAGISVLGNGGIYVGAFAVQNGMNADYFAAKLTLDRLFADGFED